MVLDMVAEDNYRLKANMSGMNPEAFWNAIAHSDALIVGSNCGRRLLDEGKALVKVCGNRHTGIQAGINNTIKLMR